MSRDSSKSVTGRDLLHLYLELRGMVPDFREWREDRLGANPPRLVRLKQLTALFRAFGIPWSPNTFGDGSFIAEGDPKHAPLLARAASQMPAAATQVHGPRGHQLPALFSILLHYRAVVEQALSFSGSVLDAGGLYYYAHWNVGKLNEVIRQHVQIIEGILVELISPDARTFTVGELVRDYGYPDDDLHQIDVEWL
jgi:hypothetical protein